VWLVPPRQEGEEGMSDFVLFNSPEAASFRTNIKGWVSRDGVFFGDMTDSERIARYAGCTHRPCDTCGKPAEKMYTLCDECRKKKDDERWEQLPKKEWDGKGMVCVYEGDEYFDDVEIAIESLMEDGMDPKDIRLVETVPVYLVEIDPNEYFVDKLPEGFALDDIRGLEVVVEAFAKLNAVIRENHMPVAFTAGKVGLDISKEVARIYYTRMESTHDR
jgi:hypothetical protein